MTNILVERLSTISCSQMWYHTRKTLNIPFDKFTGSAHERIFCGTHNVDHGYSIIDKVDPMDGTIYWRVKTIHNHSPEDDTVLVEWYGMAKANNMSWIKPEDLCKPYCEKITWRMRS